MIRPRELPPGTRCYQVYESARGTLRMSEGVVGADDRPDYPHLHSADRRLRIHAAEVHGWHLTPEAAVAEFVDDARREYEALRHGALSLLGVPEEV